MSTIKRIDWTSIGNQLTTELNSLANGGYSALSAAYDNSSTLYTWGMLVVNLASLNPTAGAYLQAFLAMSDGTNYEDAPSSTNPGLHMALRPVLLTTGSATKRVIVPPFLLPPGKMKWALLNGSNVALAASANTVALYATYDQIV